MCDKNILFPTIDFIYQKIESSEYKVYLRENQNKNISRMVDRICSRYANSNQERCEISTDVINFIKCNNNDLNLQDKDIVKIGLEMTEILKLF